MLIALAAPASARSTWAIDPSRTHISFSIDAVGYPQMHGEFRSFETRISVDFDRPALSYVKFRVQTRSVDAGSTSVSNYLRSEALFDVARFPDIAFDSTSVQKLDDRRIHIIGNLTMLGQTRPMSVDVAVERQQGGSRSHLALSARTKIDRLEFGMSSGYPIVSREVDLVVASEAIEQ
jgi:polyisoprenoid-binding protein YceI